MTFLGPWRMKLVGVRNDFLVFKSERKQERAGCWCVMWFAASVRRKNCWAWTTLGATEEDGGGIGWPLSLNGDMILQHEKKLKS